MTVVGDVAEAVTDVSISQRVGDGPWTMGIVNRHFDRLVRSGDQWLFADKRVVQHWPGGVTMRDEEQIRLTLALYSRFNDYKDEEAWTLLYAPDAVVVEQQPPPLRIARATPDLRARRRPRRVRTAASTPLRPCSR